MVPILLSKISAALSQLFTTILAVHRHRRELHRWRGIYVIIVLSRCHFTDLVTHFESAVAFLMFRFILWCRRVPTVSIFALFADKFVVRKDITVASAELIGENNALFLILWCSGCVILRPTLVDLFWFMCTNYLWWARQMCKDNALWAPLIFNNSTTKNDFFSLHWFLHLTFRRFPRLHSIWTRLAAFTVLNAREATSITEQGGIANDARCKSYRSVHVDCMLNRAHFNALSYNN